MSILIKPYELSVWEDVWDTGSSKFIEKKLGTIGSDKMIAQCRALSPKFTRNVNGVKKLTFQMYKYYVDNMTGEKVENPYMPWLISERKVKLFYEGDWHDFIIKNINENSSNYLYTYQLEDALVQELSKNGFGVTLDAKLMNNIGTANDLAKFVLSETDWSVSEQSEAFVQTIVEPLVYIVFPANMSGFSVKKIQDQTTLTQGIQEVFFNADSLAGKKALAFYSSCTNKPHRFQFIYLTDLSTLKRDEDRNIKNKDCQYYIEFDNPEEIYKKEIAKYGFYLPSGFDITTTTESGVNNITISTLYRGKRYGFSQQSKYVPVLNKYVNLYNGPSYTIDGKSSTLYYGYQHAEYHSPALTQNVISNSTFESASGWIGTHNGTSGAEKATVEAVYGRFNNGEFVNSIDDLKDGSFNANNEYKAFLKVTFKNENSRLINSGPYDNRTIIGSMDVGEEWAARLSYRKIGNLGDLSLSIGEYVYNSGANGYLPKDPSQIGFGSFGGKEGYTLTSGTGLNAKSYKVAAVNSNSYSKEQFKKKMNVRLCISPPSGATNAVYYIEEAELFRAAYDDNKKIITPEEQGTNLQNRVIDKTYYYFKPSQLDDISNEEQLVPDHTEKKLVYTTYKPIYNQGAEKIRTVTIKESNYFNILQSIAETFEAWLILKITRGDQNYPGRITKKEIIFKNYVGGTNYAGFRYGVNLKDIQRTYESKNIVTKLVVKQNSNELGENGFCTIARAGSNPLGENCIYDFQYFFNKGLLNPTSYLNTMYVINGAEGPDIPDSQKTYNLQGYFPRIKNLNNLIQDKNEILINTAKDLTKYKADLEVAEAGYDAANSGIQQTRDDFEALIGLPIDWISQDLITNITLGGKCNTEDIAKTNHGYYYQAPTWLDGDLTISIDNNNNIRVSGTANETSSLVRRIYVVAFPELTFTKNSTQKKASIEQVIVCEFAENQLTGSGTTPVQVVDTERSDVSKLLQEFAVYSGKEQNFSADKTTATSNVNSTQKIYNDLQASINNYKKHKSELNKIFFTQYSPFIQEGTWVNEEYVDDEKYYADSLSVMYNSCYPQVTYSINVLALSQLEGYEDFDFSLGEKTYAEDPEFFGNDRKEEVIINEVSEVLDDPSKNEIKVQNFKNQFQDLFQKITATVQQAQYRTGSYEKAVALAEANQERKNAFLTDALDAASARLQAAGQQSVTWGSDGITVKSVNSPNDAIRMVGGAILLSKQDENGEQKWVTGVTSDGISANLITAGILNAGEITIMNYDQPVFRWDSFGISAYDANWYQSEIGTVVSGVNTRKFVRFDKNGIYGINNSGVDGAHWQPNNIGEIDEKATFALTWEGLKVTNSNNVSLRIGDQAKVGAKETALLTVKDALGNVTFSIDETGSMSWGSGQSSHQAVYTTSTSGAAPTKPVDNKKYQEFPNTSDTEGEWHKTTSVTDNYASYTYDGGATWGNPIRIAGESVYQIQLSDTFVPVTASPSGEISDDWDYYVNISVKSGLEDRYVFQKEMASGESYYYFGKDKNTEEGLVEIEYNKSEISAVSYIDGLDINEDSYYSVGFIFEELKTDTTQVTFKLKAKQGTTTYTQASIAFAKQKKGNTGDSGYVYRLELDDTFTLVPSTNLGEIEEGTIEIQPSAFYGPDKYNYSNYSNSGTGLMIKATSSNNNITITAEESSNSPYYEIKWLESWATEKETVTFQLYNGTSLKDTKTFEIIKQKGNFGAVQCYIESSNGTVFEKNESGTTVLTARIFEGTTEIDPIIENSQPTLSYSWYKTTSPELWKSGKTFTVSYSDIRDCEIYFIAE